MIYPTRKKRVKRIWTRGRDIEEWEKNRENDRFVYNANHVSHLCNSCFFSSFASRSRWNWESHSMIAPPLYHTHTRQHSHTYNIHQHSILPYYYFHSLLYGHRCRSISNYLKISENVDTFRETRTSIKRLSLQSLSGMHFSAHKLLKMIVSTDIK